MLSIDIPGFGNLRLKHLAVDFNGTLAVDGKLLSPAGPLLRRLSEDLRIHVLTADTFGRAHEELNGLPLDVNIMDRENQADAKLTFVSRLGLDSVVAIGNGRNDQKMLHKVALGIAVMQSEGTAREAIESADVVVPAMQDALSLLLNPLRLIATMRS